MKTLKRTIVVDENAAVSAVWAIPQNFSPGETDALILAHGAGNDMNHPFLSFVHEALAAHGWLTIKFNFPYKEQGKKAPDVPATLERTFRAALRDARGDGDLKPRRLFIGGKSLGGRIASHLAAQGEEVAGLVFLGYPLHPPKQPARLRVGHWREIRRPSLFISGSKDPFCELGLLRQHLESLNGRPLLHVIEEGDHSFRVPKRTGRTERDVWEEIVAVTSRWLKQV